MFENNIFDEYLEEETKRVLKKLKNEEVLTQDDKLIMILKSQTNHFHHLDVELREDIKELRDDMNKNIKAVREDMDRNNRELRDDMNKNIKAVREDMDRNNRELREDMDKNIKAVREDMDKRFEQVDKRFDAMILRMDRFMIWSLGLTVTSTLFIIGFMFKFFGK